MGDNIRKNPVDASNPVVQHNDPPHRVRGVTGVQHPYWQGKLLNWIVPVAVLLLGALVIPDLLQKWLWMRQLNYAGIFWTLLSVKCGMTCVAFIAAFLFLWINIRQAAKNSFALAEYDTAKKAGSRREHSCHRNRGYRYLSPCCDANHGTRRGRSRCDLCAWLLCAMGHVSPLSLCWFLRVFRPGLWSRCGVLSLHSSVLSTPAEQSRIL